MELFSMPGALGFRWLKPAIELSSKSLEDVLALYLSRGDAPERCSPSLMNTLLERVETTG